MNGQPAPLRKWTDADVRARPHLERIAYHYVLDGQFDFVFLVNMQHIALREGRLTVAQTRGVLNCMTNDSTVKLPDFPTPVPRDAESLVPERRGFGGAARRAEQRWTPKCKEYGLVAGVGQIVNCLLDRDHDGEHDPMNDDVKDLVDWSWVKPHVVLMNASGPRYAVLSTGRVHHRLRKVQTSWEVDTNTRTVKLQHLVITAYCPGMSRRHVWQGPLGDVNHELSVEAPTTTPHCKACLRYMENDDG